MKKEEVLKKIKNHLNYIKEEAFKALVSGDLNNHLFFLKKRWLLEKRYEKLLKEVS